MRKTVNLRAVFSTGREIGLPHTKNTSASICLLLVSIAAWALLKERINSLTLIGFFIGSLFFVFFLLPPDAGLPEQWLAGPALAVIFLGTFTTLGAYGLYNYGVSRIPANQAAAFVNLIPVFSVILGSVLLAEKLTPWQWVAVAMGFSGIHLCRQGGIKPAC